MNYAELIPTEAPEGLFGFLQTEEKKFQNGVLAFKMVGRGFAEASIDCEEFGGDFRRDEKKKAALLWCSECEHESLAEYMQGTVYQGYKKFSGIYLKDDVHQTSGEFTDGQEMCCPYCGAGVILRSAAALRYGYHEQAFVMVASVEQGNLVLTDYCVERGIWNHEQRTIVSPFFAYVVDGKKIVKLVHYRRGLGSGYYMLRDWEQLKKLTDNVGAPVFFNKLPSLDGTNLENAKLWDYKKQAYADGKFYPLCYIRLYLQRPNVENLIMAGMGKLLGEAIGKDTQAGISYYGASYYRRPLLPWINWKDARPAQMLGLTREQLRQVRAEKWGLENFKFWQENGPKGLKFAEAVELLKETGDAYGAQEIVDSGMPPLKVVHYCKKQSKDYTYLRDYWRMAVLAGMDIEQKEVRWPPHLKEAHDRAMKAQKCNASQEVREAFDRLVKQCAGLCWEHNGICIRPAASPEELVWEGNILHHCVGGYAKTHANGQIILFIRHSRRPERSWFTLNVDIFEKKIIQNHGYANEFVNGKKLKIPKEVQEFVTQWKEQILDHWELEPIEKQKKKKTKTKTKAA